MNQADRAIAPQFDLAQGFAEHVLAWARALGAPAASLAVLPAVARELSLSAAAGHVCMPLLAFDATRGDASPAPPMTADVLRARLLASGVVATAAQAERGAHPLVLDDRDSLYLRRFFDLEGRLAAALVTRARSHVDGEAPPGLLDALFPPRPAPAGPDWQRLAVALAMKGRLTVISGGPGTGKTTTVAALLACLMARDPGLRIALAAPTGKAAARLLEALRRRAAHLPAGLRARLPDEVFTVHRLLGVTPRPGRFRHDADNPLAVDVLVVDEASMLDLALAARLVDALAPDARLVLLGDKDQLAAVEAGAVFAELSAARSLTPATMARLAQAGGIPVEAIASAVPTAAEGDSALADSVIWLSESYRFQRDSGIGRLAADINAGDGAAALAWLRKGEDTSAAWIADDAPRPCAATLACMEAGYAPYLACLRHPAGDAQARVAAAFAAFDRFRVLAAVHQGARGLAAINAHLERHLRSTLELPMQAGAGARWYTGRPLIVLRNDYLLGLYNGDVGLCLPDDDGALAVWFPQAHGGFRAIAPMRLPAHDTAFALTVHKSQGSEFDEVLLVLPAEISRVLTRELLYTGVTRAAARVTLAGPPEVFAHACATRTQRLSGLGSRMNGGDPARDAVRCGSEPIADVGPASDGRASMA